jgi:hypothetical protein
MPFSDRLSGLSRKSTRPEDDLRATAARRLSESPNTGKTLQDQLMGVRLLVPGRQ